MQRTNITLKNEMKFGYARTKENVYGMSKNGQLWKLKRAKCNLVFVDEEAPLEEHRPEFKKCLNSLRPGDSLIVCSLQTLAPSLPALTKIIRHCRQMDIRIQVLDQDINRETLAALELAGEFQESINQEKRQEGIGRAKSNNAKFGRPTTITDDMKQKALSMKRAGYTVKQITDQLDISETSYYRIMKELRNSNVSIIKAVE